MIWVAGSFGSRTFARGHRSACRPTRMETVSMVDFTTWAKTLHVAFKRLARASGQRGSHMGKTASLKAKPGTIAVSPSKRAGGKRYVILSGKVDVAMVPNRSKRRSVKK
jgi:hypothetical protein